MAQVHEQGVDFWTLAVTRELDDLILDLRTNESELGTWVWRTVGDAAAVLAYDDLLLDNADDWLAVEIVLYLKRTLKRLDVTSRSLIALIEPGSCFAGSLLELALAADRSYQLDGVFEEDPDASPAAVTIGPMNLGPLPMGNGLTRLATRFYGDPSAPATAGGPYEAQDAERLGLVTFIPDDLDWVDEVRIAVEERASFSAEFKASLPLCSLPKRSSVIFKPLNSVVSVPPPLKCCTWRTVPFFKLTFCSESWGGSLGLDEFSASLHPSKRGSRLLVPSG
jgi:benzoyl-CoA-dihydrodiol lyase